MLVSEGGFYRPQNMLQVVSSSLAVTIEMAAPVGSGNDRPKAACIRIRVRNRRIETTETCVSLRGTAICGMIFVK